MKEQIARINNIDISYQAFGNINDPAIILMMGNSAQGIMWPDDFCQKLAALKFHVIRFDYRDTGLSSCCDYEKAAYNLMDLMKDVIGLVDHLKIQKAHFIGLSMGGAIALLLAVHYPDRILSITTMMSSPDLSIKNNAFKGLKQSEDRLPPPAAEFIRDVINLNSIAPNNREEKIKQLVENWRLANGSKASFDEAYWQELMEKCLDREEKNLSAKEIKFANHSNHTKAQMASTEPNLGMLDKINCPTLILQGSADPIFPKAHAEIAASLIPRAQLHIVNNMGHALNPVFFDELLSVISKHLFAHEE